MQIRALPFQPQVRSAPMRAVAAVSTSQLDPTKCALVESMIRTVPNEGCRLELQQALQAMPSEALARIAEYGTVLEVYDKNAADLPLYAQHLRKPHLVGAYSPTANVVFVDQHNITPLVLLHEVSHALDMALGEPSKGSGWVEGCPQPRPSRACIRPYATHNSAEYFADNLAAHLIGDAQLPSMLKTRLQQQPQLDKTELVKAHVNYCNGRQRLADSTAYGLCADLLQAMPSLPQAAPRPALGAEEYLAVKRAELLARKQQEALQGVR